MQELFACFIMTACLHRKHFTPQFDATGAEVGRQGARRRGDEYVHEDTKGGCVDWVGPGPFNTRSRCSGSVERTIWARVPLQSRRGRCVALRLRGDVLLVGIAGAPAVQWLPAHQVLTATEAAAWGACGF